MRKKLRRRILAVYGTVFFEQVLPSIASVMRVRKSKVYEKRILFFLRCTIIKEVKYLSTVPLASPFIVCMAAGFVSDVLKESISKPVAVAIFAGTKSIISSIIEDGR